MPMIGPGHAETTLVFVSERSFGLMASIVEDEEPYPLTDWHLWSGPIEPPPLPKEKP